VGKEQNSGLSAPLNSSIEVITAETITAEMITAEMITALDRITALETPMRLLERSMGNS
jgi:hypothetical protein